MELIRKFKTEDLGLTLTYINGKLSTIEGFENYIEVKPYPETMLYLNCPIYIESIPVYNECWTKYKLTEIPIPRKMKIPKLTNNESLVLAKMPVNEWVSFGIEVYGTDLDSDQLLPEDVVRKTMLNLVSKWAVEKADNGLLFRRRPQTEIIEIFNK